MTGSSATLSVREVSTATAQKPLACDDPWRRWQERGARLDARIGRNMRVTTWVVSIALTIGAIWVMASSR
jgi:hypothetical protein